MAFVSYICIMFKPIISILFILSFSLNAFGQWKKIYTGISEDLYDVQTIFDRAYACGQSSKILVSKDSGLSWKPLSLTIPANLRCLYFFDSLHGMVSGENARVQMTYNGGKTWTQKYVRTAAYTYDIAFNGTYGLMVGNSLLVTSSANSGETWQVDTTPDIEKQLNSVAISNGGICWAVGDSGIVLTKLLSGHNWSKIHVNTQVNLTNVNLFGDSVIIISGGMADPNQVGIHYNVFLKSVDTGKTWEQSIIPEMKSIYSGYFTSPDTGILCGSNGIICKIYHPLYTRGQQLSGTASILNRVTYSDGYGLIVGDGGVLLRTTNFGGKGLGVNNKGKTHDFVVYPNPSYNFLHISNSNKIEHLEIINAEGKSIQVNQVDGRIDISKLDNGFYFLKIVTENGIITLPFSKA